MGTKKKLARDLRDAGLRKKRARALAESADQARSGDRAARSLVDEQSAALRDSISATVRHAKPPRTRSARKATAQKKSSAATKKAGGSSRPTAKKGRLGRSARGSDNAT